MSSLCRYKRKFYLQIVAYRVR